MFRKGETSNTGMTKMLVASTLLTFPFIYYARDIAESLRDISGRNQIDINNSASQQ